MIDASVELQERERTKFAAVTAAIRTALEQRGTETGTAHLVAQIAMVVFQSAFDQWVNANGQTDFVTCLRVTAASLRDTVTADSTNRTPG
ncbi:hypothetical protein ACWDRB_07830 [Nonomuraea sp. NPDC003707]